MFWIGAGAGQWAELPSWRELARSLRHEFYNVCEQFDNSKAVALLNKECYPALFQLCRDADSQLYFRTIADLLERPKPGDVYLRFIEQLSAFNPISLVTTNVDTCLEQHLPGTHVVGTSNLARITDHLRKRESFVAKFHGSSSSIEKTVFTTEDYAALIRDRQFMASVQALLRDTSLVFLGYGLRDNYLLQLLAEDAENNALFGSGPHFAVTARTDSTPIGIHRINYEIKRSGDHRAALTILDWVSQCQPHSVSSLGERPDSEATETSFLISDFKPPGKYQDGHSFTFAQDGLPAGSMMIGLGFIDQEMVTSESRALHDLLVGLICFDRVYVPLESVAPLLATVGESCLSELVDSDALRFVHIDQRPAIRFDVDSLLGVLSLVTIKSKDGVSALSPLELLQREIVPVHGRESAAERLLEKLTSRTVRFGEAERLDLPSTVRSAILMPRISRMLGASDALGPSKVPKWLAHPYLRLAHLVHANMICNHFNIESVRVPFGGACMVSAAFGVGLGGRSADEYASYALTGRHDSNLGRYVEADPSLLLRVLRFRETVEGKSLRKSIGAALDQNLWLRVCNFH